jgi:hypothetical protein
MSLSSKGMRLQTLFSQYVLTVHIVVVAIEQSVLCLIPAITYFDICQFEEKKVVLRYLCLYKLQRQCMCYMFTSRFRLRFETITFLLPSIYRVRSCVALLCVHILNFNGFTSHATNSCYFF